MPDITINPSTPVSDGQIVSAANPLPCVSESAGTPVADVTISPSTWVVNGQIVSLTNPLPITLA